MLGAPLSPQTAMDYPHCDARVVTSPKVYTIVSCTRSHGAHRPSQRRLGVSHGHSHSPRLHYPPRRTGVASLTEMAFHNPVRIISGAGASRSLGKILGYR
jgi:hypothetical protein